MRRVQAAAADGRSRTVCAVSHTLGKRNMEISRFGEQYSEGREQRDRGELARDTSSPAAP